MAVKHEVTEVSSPEAAAVETEATQAFTLGADAVGSEKLLAKGSGPDLFSLVAAAMVVTFVAYQFLYGRKGKTRVIDCAGKCATPEACGAKGACAYRSAS